MEISGLGDVPLLRKDIKIRPFSDGSSPGSKFLVEVGASHFLVNAEMHSLLVALQECPTTLSELAEKLTKLTGKVVSLDTLRTVLQSKPFASLFDDLPKPRAGTPFLLNFQLISAAPLKRITSRITWLFSWPLVSLSMAAFFIIQYLLISSSLSATGASRSWAGLLWLYLGIAIGGLFHEV